MSPSHDHRPPIDQDKSSSISSHFAEQFRQEVIESIERRGNQDSSLTYYVSQTFTDTVIAQAIGQGFTGAVIASINERKDSSDLYRVTDSSPFTFARIIDQGYTANELLSLLEARDKSGNFIFQELDLSYLERKYFKASDILAISQIENSSGTRLFVTMNWILNALEVSTTILNLEEHAALRTDSGLPVFSHGVALHSFLRDGGTVHLARAILEFRLEDGTQLVTCGSDLAEYATALIRQEPLQDLLAAKNQGGQNIFRYMHDAYSFLQAGGSETELREFAGILSSSNRPYFSGFEIALLKEAGVSPVQAQEIAARGIDGATGALSHYLRIPGGTYLGNGKPKMLLMVTTNDTPQLGGRIFYDGGAANYSNFLPHYDLCVQAVFSREHALKVLAESCDAQVVIVAGHGNSDGINLSRELSRYGLNKNLEVSFGIRIGDREFLEALQSLPHGCSLFLDSCLTACETEGRQNFATFTATGAKHLTVIASQEVFSPERIAFHSVLPFDISIVRGLREISSRWIDGIRQPSRLDPEWYQRPVKAIPASVMAQFAKVLAPHPSRTKLDRANQEIAESMSPLFYCDDWRDASKLFTDMPGVEILEPHDLNMDNDVYPADYVFGGVLQKPWCAHRTQNNLTLLDMWRNPLDALAARGYVPTLTPTTGDIALYIEINASKVGYARHIGVMCNGRVQSKCRMAPALLHDVAGVHTEAGTHVMFFTER